MKRKIKRLSTLISSIFLMFLIIIYFVISYVEQKNDGDLTSEDIAIFSLSLFVLFFMFGNYLNLRKESDETNSKIDLLITELEYNLIILKDELAFYKKDYIKFYYNKLPTKDFILIIHEEVLKNPYVLEYPILDDLFDCYTALKNINTILKSKYGESSSNKKDIYSKKIFNIIEGNYYGKYKNKPLMYLITDLMKNLEEYKKEI